MIHSIEVLVAHAIHRHIDIIEDFPELRECTEKEMEKAIQGYIFSLQGRLSVLCEMAGHPNYVDHGDAMSLWGYLKAEGVQCVRLREMCETIIGIESGAIILPPVKEGEKVGPYYESKIFQALKNITPFNP